MQYINTCNGSRGSYYNLILEVIQNSQSIENNTSNVTMSAYIQSNHSSYYFYGYSATTNLTFNGSTKATNTVTVDTRNGNKVLLATWTGNVEHNSDGTLKVNVGATFTCNYSYVTGGSVSGQFEFNTIPRASKFGNIPDFTLDGNEGVGAPFSVPITKKSSVLTDTLQIYMPTSSGYTLVATRNNYTSGTVTFSSSELNTIYPLFTTTQVNFRFNLTTKNGSNTIGTDEVYALGKLSTTGLNPTFSNINLTYKDVNSVTTAITGNNQIIIKDFSEMQIILNSKATAHKGATMKNYILGSTSDLQTFSASASLPFTVTENFPNQSYYAKAIDSRGNQTQVTKNVQTFINYELPNSIKINLKRSNNGAGESVSVSISGKYYNWTGLAVNNEITNISVDYREKGSSTWSYAVNLTSTSSNGNFSVSETSLGNFDVSKEYEFRFGITDKLSSVTENITLNSGEPYIWHMKNSKIMGIGGKPSSNLPEGSLQLYGDLIVPKRLSSPVQVNGDPTGDFRNIFFRGEGSCYDIKQFRQSTGSISYFPQYGAGLAVSSGDTHFYIDTSYSTRLAYIGAGNGYSLKWKGQLCFKEDGYINGYLGTISSGDFNNYTTQGEYLVQAGTTIINAPYTGNIYGKLIITHSKGSSGTGSSSMYIYQKFLDTSGREFTRYKINNDGWTTWVYSSPCYCEITNSETVTMTFGNAWTWHTVPLNTTLKKYGLGLSKNGNGIQIGKGVHTVKITATYNYYNNDVGGGDIQANIFKNTSATKMLGYVGATSASYTYVSFTGSIITSVVEGDLLYLKVEGSLSNKSVRIFDGTMLMVEVLD